MFKPQPDVKPNSLSMEVKNNIDNQVRAYSYKIYQQHPYTYPAILNTQIKDFRNDLESKILEREELQFDLELQRREDNFSGDADCLFIRGCHV